MPSPTRARRTPSRLGVELLEDRTTPALVAAYGFEDGAGATTADSSGSGLIGTLANAAWTTAGRYGNALAFNGTNAWVTVADNNLLDLTTGITLEAWVRPAAATTDWSTAILKERGTAGFTYALYAADGANRPPAGYVYRGGDKSAVGTAALPVNTWAHLATTYDGAVLRLYVNGTQVAARSQTGATATSASPLRIGGNAVWGEYFNGLIDEVRVYNHALTQAQIQADMATPVVSGPDTTPPTVALTAPANSATLGGTVSVSAAAADNVAVAGVQFLLDGNPLGAEDTTAPYSTSWNTTTVADGAHVLTAVARDAAGNTTTAAVVTVTVANTDATPPTVTVTAPAEGATVSGTASVTAAAADNVAVVGVQFQLDGVALGAEDTTAPYSVAWNTTTAANGPHALTAVARDAAGNTTTAAVVTVTVANADTTPPTVALSAPANNATVGGTVAVSGTAADNVGVVGVQFFLDGNPLGDEDTTAPYSVAWDTTAAANGTHTLTARARDAAGNVTTSAARTVTVSNVVTDPAQVGQWSSVMDWPLVAIHSVLLNDGRVLMWDGDAGGLCIGSSSARVWSPATNTFTPVPIPYFATQDDDIWCSGQTVMADGRVLVVGGHDCDGPQLGIKMTNIFDPATMTWTRGPDMAYRRWYPTTTLLADGRVLATAGSVNNTLDYVPLPEIYDPVTNTWTVLTAANQTIPNYAFVFQDPGGRVMVTGSDEAKMASYSLSVATQTWATVDAAVLDAGSGVMYAPGKYLKAGSSYLSAPADNGGNVPSAATTYVLDTTQPAPLWQSTAPMAEPRTHLNLTLLPDGSVLATGGSRDIGGLTPSRAVLSAELWSPATQTWATMSSMQTPRMYHSTALLLPDGRVMVAGGGRLFTTNYFSAEIYSPAYLFKGPRPTISSSPGALAYGSNFFVGTPDAAGIASVSLVRNGSVTHSFNMDQRRVPLAFQVVDGGLTVAAPADANAAPPGTYMLFIVNAAGVPSIAPFVRLPAGYEDGQAPTAPADLTAVATSETAIALTWAAATDNVGVTGYNVYRSTTGGFAPSAANLVGQTAGTTFTDSGLPPGTFYYRVVARDAAGNTSPPSNEVGATVTGDVTAPSVSLTAPAPGATVSGSVAVTATASDDVGVVGVQFFLDGAPLGAEDTTAPYSVAWNTAAAANGTYTLTARARDAAGNATTSAEVTVTVSNTGLSGLVGAWGFEEASGPAADASGNGHTGTINGPARVAGRYGQGLSFDGLNDLVTVADTAALDFTTGMTLSAWVRPTTTSGWRTVVLKEAPGALAYGLYTSGDGTRPSGYVRVGGNDSAAIGPSALSTTAWTHLAVTYDAAAIRLFVNGTQVSTTARTGSIQTSANPLQIGGNTIWGEWFSGLIDEVRVYNRALSAAEIQTDLNTPVVPGSPQLPAEGAVPGGSAPVLTAADLAPVVAEAVRRWEAAGLDPQRVADLRRAVVRIADLSATGELGLAVVGGSHVTLDDDGAGRGWFIDPTPADDAEFAGRVAPTQVRAAGGPVAGGYDLLTVVMHELGHVLGLDDLDPGVVPHDLLTATLSLGTRRFPAPVADVVPQTDGPSDTPAGPVAVPQTDTAPVMLSAEPTSPFVWFGPAAGESWSASVTSDAVPAPAARVRDEPESGGRSDTPGAALPADDAGAGFRFDDGPAAAGPAEWELLDGIPVD